MRTTYSPYSGAGFQRWQSQQSRCSAPTSLMASTETVRPDDLQDGSTVLRVDPRSTKSRIPQMSGFDVQVGVLLARQHQLSSTDRPISGEGDPALVIRTFVRLGGLHLPEAIRLLRTAHRVKVQSASTTVGGIGITVAMYDLQGLDQAGGLDGRGMLSDTSDRVLFCRQAGASRRGRRRAGLPGIGGPQFYPEAPSHGIRRME